MSLVQRNLVPLFVAFLVVLLSDLLREGADNLDTKLGVAVDGPQVAHYVFVKEKVHIVELHFVVACVEVATLQLALGRVDPVEGPQVARVCMHGHFECLQGLGPATIEQGPARLYLVEVNDLPQAFPFTPKSKPLRAYLELMNSIMSLMYPRNCSVSALGYICPKIM